VVAYLASCHHAIGKLFDGIKLSHEQGTDKNLHAKANLLLDYFSKQQNQLESAIKAYGGDAPISVSEEWMDYNDGAHLLEYIESIDNHKSMSFDDVVNLTIDLEQRIIGFAQDMASHVTSDNAKDAFLNIVTNEERRLESMINQSNAFNDL